MKTIAELGSRWWLTIPTMVALVLTIALVQHMVVLELDFGLRRMMLPAMVGLLTGGMITYIAKLNVRSQHDARALAARQAENQLLNDELQHALEDQLAISDALREQLDRAQRLESVGYMAAGLAHDLNNVLTVILGHAHFLELLDSAEARELADEIRVAGRQGAGLTGRLLDYVRGQQEPCTEVEITGLIHELQPLLEQVVSRVCPLELELAPGAIYVAGGGLDQVILNLVTNARDAMVGRVGSIRLRCVVDGEHVVLEVSDDGVGMVAEQLAQATQPLYTTKTGGMGTGLGLAVVARQIERVGGELSLESRAGVGTSIRLRLPRLTDGHDESASSVA